MPRAGRALVFALLVLLIPYVLVYLLFYFLSGIIPLILIWAAWLPRGKDTLIVTSDSPIWGTYMADHIIAPLGEQAYTLNWSDRRSWLNRPSLQAWAFRRFGGRREFNPLVVVFHPLTAPRVFRYWSAFKDFKRGDPGPVERITAELFEYLS
jgi:hypothetical protein